ncbi:unnamed protein product [Linum trigynum]|uniref:Uncharacterized protein n=1 Tax=Linum trigynum TaxID=586398 RepID=A0AAV2G0L0_9ROSI
MVGRKVTNVSVACVSFVRYSGLEEIRIDFQCCPIEVIRLDNCIAKSRRSKGVYVILEAELHLLYMLDDGHSFWTSFYAAFFKENNIVGSLESN